MSAQLTERAELVQTGQVQVCSSDEIAHGRPDICISSSHVRSIGQGGAVNVLDALNASRPCFDVIQNYGSGIQK
jgi:hypothetical protein